MRFILTIALFLCSVLSFSQTTDEQLAGHYFNGGEFQKAKIYYEKLYQSKPSRTYYEKLIVCYKELKLVKDAEKLIKKSISRYKSDPRYVIDLGNLYEKNNQEDKADKEYLKAIDAMPASQGMIKIVGQAFIDAGKYEYAEITYKKGAKLLNNRYRFNIELANLFGIKGDKEGMINEYLNLLELSDRYLSYIKSAFNKYLDLLENDSEAELLKLKLLEHIQSNKNNEQYIGLLSWLFIQRGEFNKAYIQLKALDKRMNDEGLSMFDLGKIALKNQDFSSASKCFEYIILNHPNSYIYFQSKAKLLYAQKLVLESNNYSTDDVLKLEQNYIAAINEFGKNKETALIIRDYANLLAFYKSNQDTAILILTEALNVPGLSDKTIALLKIDLADIFLFKGEVWNANILYNQVEKDFKNEVLGQKAKFKAAKVSFYVSEFEWAQSQLDILKASTSRLISNDAMQLSLTITDNMGLDSTTEALTMFAQADLLMYQRRFDEALNLLDSINFKFPLHKLEDEIYFLKYNIYFDMGKYELAKKELLLLIQEHASDILGDDAYFNLGKLEEDVFQNKENAMEYYEKIILDYSASIFLTESRKRYRKLREEIQ